MLLATTRYSEQLTQPPENEPITRADLIAFAHIDDGCDVATLDKIIAGVRAACEEITERALITQSWSIFFDAWPTDGVIELPRPPLQSAIVKYFDADGAEQTLPAEDYTLDIGSAFGRVLLNGGATWPALDTNRPANRVTVEMVAGYGDSGAAVNGDLITAMLRHGKSRYDSRNDFAIGSGVAEIPDNALTVYKAFRPGRV